MPEEPEKQEQEEEQDVISHTRQPRAEEPEGDDPGLVFRSSEDEDDDDTEAHIRRN